MSERLDDTIKQSLTHTREYAVEMLMNINKLVDHVTRLQNDNCKYQKTLKEILEHYTKPSRSQSNHCTSCDSFEKEIQLLNAENNKLEYVKSFSEDLKNQNEQLKMRNQELESEQVRYNRQLADYEQKYSSDQQEIERLQQDALSIKRNAEQCKQHINVLVVAGNYANQLYVVVDDAVRKNVELIAINKHQGCIIKEYQDTIDMLKKKLLNSQF